MKYIIDHPTYGTRKEFDDLEDAELSLQDLGEDYLGTNLKVKGEQILDETGQVIGAVEDDD